MDDKPPLQQIAEMGTLKATNKLYELLQDDCFDAVSRGHWSVRIGQWPDGWRAAIVETDPNEPVMCVGPRRRVVVETTETHMNWRVVTE